MAIARRTGLVGLLLALARLVVATAILPGIAFGAGSSAPNRCLQLDSIHVENWVGDPFITAVAIDSLVRVLLTLDQFETVAERGYGTGSSTFWLITNPFSTCTETSADTLRVTLELELEQSSYGPPIDPKHDLAVFWAFGILGTALSGGGRTVASEIEWRVTAHVAGRDQPIVVVAMGIAAADVRRLSRRDATSVADKRALWDVGYALSDALNAQLKLGLKTRVHDGALEEYVQKVDSWTSLALSKKPK